MYLQRLVSTAIASVLIIQLVSAVPGAARRVLKQIRKIEIAYREALKLTEVE